MLPSRAAAEAPSFPNPSSPPRLQPLSPSLLPTPMAMAEPFPSNDGGLERAPWRRITGGGGVLAGDASGVAMAAEA
jgi:hypothetical protein